MPDSVEVNFRQRLVTELEESNGLVHTDAEFRSKAEALLGFYEKVFGVDDLVERTDEGLE